MCGHRTQHIRATRIARTIQLRESNRLGGDRDEHAGPTRRDPRSRHRQHRNAPPYLGDRGEPTEELRAWGWRIPFGIGAVAAVIAFFLRRSLTETTSEAVRAQKDAGTLKGVFRYPRSFPTVLGFTAGGSLVFYTFTTYMQKYLVNTAGMDTKVASRVMIAVLFCYMLLQPVFGALSDRIGRCNSMLCFGVFTLVATVPILSALAHAKDPYAAFGLVMIALAGVSFYTSISGLVKAELFPMHVRSLGVGLSYAIANAGFGGSAEYVALWFKSIGRESTFFWYVTAMCAIALVAAIVMPDTRRSGHMKEDDDVVPAAF